uniref:PspC domain-containing protein n=1 Tax=Roseihalotalea indica TaxID=2867963 RepID=A0AA49JFJ3_9BACT|nr:PspC domain-containing protein [Tunicatimonas sp. TK19036]
MAKLTLSRNNKIIAGVCGGLAAHFGWDATLVRILFAIAGIIGVGSPGIVYLVLWLVMKYS